jgi:hypothetical protein
MTATAQAARVLCTRGLRKEHGREASGRLGALAGLEG